MQSNRVGRLSYETKAAIHKATIKAAMTAALIGFAIGTIFGYGWHMKAVSTVQNIKPVFTYEETTNGK